MRLLSADSGVHHALPACCLDRGELAAQATVNEAGRGAVEPGEEAFGKADVDLSTSAASVAAMRRATICGASVALPRAWFKARTAGGLIGVSARGAI